MRGAGPHVRVGARSLAKAQAVLAGVANVEIDCPCASRRGMLPALRPMRLGLVLRPVGTRREIPLSPVRQRAEQLACDERLREVLTESDGARVHTPLDDRFHALIEHSARSDNSLPQDSTRHEDVRQSCLEMIEAVPPRRDRWNARLRTVLRLATLMAKPA